MVYCHVMNTYTYQRDCFNLGNFVFLQVNYSCSPFFSFVYLFHLFVFDSLSKGPSVNSWLILSSLYEAKLVSNLWHYSYLCLPNAGWACCSTYSWQKIPTNSKIRKWFILLTLSGTIHHGGEGTVVGMWG